MLPQIDETPQTKLTILKIVYVLLNSGFYYLYPKGKNWINTISSTCPQLAYSNSWCYLR